MQRPILTFVVLLAVGSAATARATLVASWSGDGNANGLVPAHNGTLVNGTSFAPGIVGQAFSFDGTDDRVDVADDPVWQLGGGSGPFTIALWANFDTIKAVAGLTQISNPLLGQSPGPGVFNKWLFYYEDEGNLVFHVTNGGSTFLVSPSTVSSLDVNEWHHFAMTRSGSTFEFFYDGNSLGTQSSSAVIPNLTVPLTFGSAEGTSSPARHIDGRLDLVQIYDVALLQSDIMQLASVPEPSSLLLCTLGLATLCVSLACRRQGTVVASGR